MKTSRSPDLAAQAHLLLSGTLLQFWTSALASGACGCRPSRARCRLTPPFYCKEPRGSRVLDERHFRRRSRGGALFGGVPLHLSDEHGGSAATAGVLYVGVELGSRQVFTVAGEGGLDSAGSLFEFPEDVGDGCDIGDSRERGAVFFLLLC